VKGIVEDVYILQINEEEVFVVRPVSWVDYQKGYQEYSVALALSDSPYPNLGMPEATEHLAEAFKFWGIPEDVFSRLTVPQVHSLVLSRPELDEYDMPVMDAQGRQVTSGSYVFQLNQNLFDGTDMLEEGKKNLKKKLKSQELTVQTSPSGPSVPITPKKTLPLWDSLLSKFKRA
jgi:hypothetical protein